MADTLNASNLIVEDARQSRGFILDDESLVEQERELNEDLKEQDKKAYNSPRRKGKKGKEADSLLDESGYDLDAIEHPNGDAQHDRYSNGQSSSANKSAARRAAAAYDSLSDTEGDDEREMYDGGSSSRVSGQASEGPSTSPSRKYKEYEQRQRHPHQSSTPLSLANRDHLTQDSSNGAYDAPYQIEERRATDRLLATILARDPLKELEDEHTTRQQQITKQEVRSAYWRSMFMNVLFVLAWYFCSTLISLYNKWMFSPEHYNFGYPLFVTSCHMLVQFFLCSLVLTIFPTLRPTRKPKAKDYGSKVLPCGLATGLDIGLSNLSLKTITLSFYTMCKSSTLGFVLIWAFIFRLERPTLPLIGIISVITAGVIMMVSSETQFHLVGMIQVLTASCLSGLRWSLTQMLLDKESMGMNNPFATLFWLAPIMGISLAICSIFIEGWFTIFSSEFFDGFDRILLTIGVIALPGAIAFAMNVAEFGLIQRTSVVTLSVAGIFKEVITIFLSTVVFHDQLTPINISGLCVAIVGIGLYNYLKFRNYKATEKKVLANGGAAPLRNASTDGVNDEAEMEALQPSRTRISHDGGQFQLVGENDFDSSDESEDNGQHSRGMEAHTSKSHLQHQDSFDRLPAYADTHLGLKTETRELEEKVSRDPLLVDIDREGQQLEREMRHRS